jgi:hypothetical protein
VKRAEYQQRVGDIDGTVLYVVLDKEHCGESELISLCDRVDDEKWT